MDSAAVVRTATLPQETSGMQKEVEPEGERERGGDGKRGGSTGPQAPSPYAHLATIVRPARAMRRPARVGAAGREIILDVTICIYFWAHTFQAYTKLRVKMLVRWKYSSLVDGEY